MKLTDSSFWKNIVKIWPRLKRIAFGLLVIAIQSMFGLKNGLIRGLKSLI